jgi:hypothetical protein
LRLGGGGGFAEIVMVGSSVVFDGPDGAAVSGVLTAGVSADGVPAAGASGGGEGCVGVDGGVCAEARTLSAARTHNATAY